MSGFTNTTTMEVGTTLGSCLVRAAVVVAPTRLLPRAHTNNSMGALCVLIDHSADEIVFEHLWGTFLRKVV